MKEYKFKINGKDYNVTVGTPEGKTVTVNVNGTDYAVEMENAPAAAAPAPVAAPAQTAAPAPSAAAQPAAPAAPAAGAGTVVPTPMPGVIIEVSVREGEAVKTGQKIAVLEAMKMENEISATKDGTVSRIHVTKGASVNEGDPIITIA